ncbi:hypothetical protein WJX81_003663 [Elliptochloris bilobata]|uniref:Uncharacterized protein n=1 Tax=Elliptochloris bilobata TaxID=381761 RepID=A0AAW1SLM1_9CHLO
MDSFLKQAASQVTAAADKASVAAQSKFGDNVAEQIKKGGQLAADKLQTMDVNQVLTQTGLADKAKAMGINLPSGAGSTAADPNAEKAAVAVAAPGIVKDATGEMAKTPEGASPGEKAAAEKAASTAAPEMLSAALGAVGLGGAKGDAVAGAPPAGGAPMSLAGAEEFLKKQCPGLMSQAEGLLKGGGAQGGGSSGGEAGLAAKAEQFAKSAAPGLLSKLGLGGEGGGAAATQPK